MSRRTNIVAIACLLAAACGGTSTEVPTSPAPDNDPTNGNGKADEFGTPTIFEGECAADAPTVPYQPVPDGTRAQPEGPEILHTRIGVPLAVDFANATPVVGEFTTGDCGRHYFVFTLDRATRLTLGGTSFAGDEPTPLDLCFARPEFLRIDTPWYTDIWEKQSFSDPVAPCGTFVPNGDVLEPADGKPLELPPGTYELTIDPQMGAATYDLEFEWQAIGSAICGDGIRDAGEGCDDGNQHPLDWCGADCRPQRLDIEPISNNETTATAQPLDGFRVVNFYAPPGDKEVDVYSVELHAGETVALTVGERICRDTVVQMFREDGTPVAEPWDCNAMQGSPEFVASSDGTHYLRFETAAGGARSVSARLLP